MIVFLITNFHPTLPAAVVYENDRDTAIRCLKEKLIRERIPFAHASEWIVSPLTPLPKYPKALVIDESYTPPRSAAELRGNVQRSTINDR